jgi:hypothetical protein
VQNGNKGGKSTFHFVSMGLKNYIYHNLKYEDTEDVSTI